MTSKFVNYYILLIIATIATSSCGQKKSKPTKMIEAIDKTEVHVFSLLTISKKNEEFKLAFVSTKDTTIQLEMLVGKNEAQTLTITLEKMKPSAPLPLDVLQEAITKFGYTVKEAIIDSLIDNIYTAKIICAKGNKIVDFAARPIDATTIALKFDAPIFVRTDLLKR